MRSQKNRFWRGLVIGGVVGGVIALLFAPKNGQEIRRDIRKKADAMKDEAERKMRRLRRDGRLLLVRTMENAMAAGNAVVAAAQQIADGKRRKS
jgi:hypothetical protein